MVGKNAGGGSAQQGDSIFIGHDAGFGGSEANSNEAIFLGHGSGYNNTGDKNTFIGYKAEVIQSYHYMKITCCWTI